MKCPLVTRMMALAASLGIGAGIGAGAAEAHPASPDKSSERGRSQRTVASTSVSVSAGVTVLEGVRVTWPGSPRAGLAEPALAQANADSLPASASRSTYVDRARGVVVISLDLS